VYAPKSIFRHLLNMGTATINPQAREARKPLPSPVHEVHRCEACGVLMFLKPIIQCGHCGRILPLRCFSYKESDGFYAECIDLNLLARGNTLEEAIVRLQEQMFSYVATAFEGNTDGLIPRRAPLWSFVRYYLSVIGNRFTGRSHSHSKAGELQISGATIVSHC
jgi:predicted RNase H-like HicB family nuclease